MLSYLEMLHNPWRMLYIENNGNCAICGRSFEDTPLRKITVDHFVPKSQGGINEPENYVGVCWECNHNKADVVNLNVPEVYPYLTNTRKILDLTFYGFAWYTDRWFPYDTTDSMYQLVAGLFKSLGWYSKITLSKRKDARHIRYAMPEDLTSMSEFLNLLMCEYTKYSKEEQANNKEIVHGTYIDEINPYIKYFYIEDRVDLRFKQRGFPLKVRVKLIEKAAAWVGGPSEIWYPWQWNMYNTIIEERKLVFHEMVEVESNKELPKEVELNGEEKEERKSA